MKLRINDDKIDGILDVSDDEIPEMAEFEMKPKQSKISDLHLTINEQLDRLDLPKKVKPKSKIAITAGSRGINNIDQILKYCIKYLKNIGADPFLFPSMGSHGGANREGQIEVLNSLGITQQDMGCPIKATMKVRKIGETEQGLPVLVDDIAARADGVLVVNRIKPHTAFSGKIESGLVKMMVIGMGKQKGARIAHKQGFTYGLDTIISSIGKIILGKLNIIGGLALVENFYDEIAILEGIKPQEFFVREKSLLTQAKELMPTFPVKDIDILIIDKMGKNISGTGMDTNVIGRFMTLGVKEPETPSISRIYIRDLTEASHGNAIGVGLADFAHQRLINKIELEDTYINSLTGAGPEKSRIPPFFQKDKTALKACLASIGVASKNANILWIKNTRELSKFFASRSLIEGIDPKKRKWVKQKGPWSKFQFDAKGNFLEGVYFG